MVDPGRTVGATPSEGEMSGAAEAEREACSPPGIRDLVLENYQSVYRYAYRLTGRADDAEDVCQQTFLVAQRKLHQLREPDKALRWLFAILRSCYLKGLRRQRPVPASNLELNVDNVPDSAVRKLQDEGVDEERLQQALDEMPDEFRIILVLFYFEDLSYKEISATLEIPIGTVMSRLSRAKGRLRHRLMSLDSADRAKAGGQQGHSRFATPPAGTTQS